MKSVGATLSQCQRRPEGVFSNLAQVLSRNRAQAFEETLYRMMVGEELKGPLLVCM